MPSSASCTSDARSASAARVGSRSCSTLLAGTPLPAHHAAPEDGPHAALHDGECRRAHAGSSKSDNPGAEDQVMTRDLAGRRGRSARSADPPRRAGVSAQAIVPVPSGNGMPATNRAPPRRPRHGTTGWRPAFAACKNARPRAGSAVVRALQRAEARRRGSSRQASRRHRCGRVHRQPSHRGPGRSCAEVTAFCW